MDKKTGEEHAKKATEFFKQYDLKIVSGGLSFFNYPDKKEVNWGYYCGRYTFTIHIKTIKIDRTEEEVYMELLKNIGKVIREEDGLKNLRGEIRY